MTSSPSQPPRPRKERKENAEKRRRQVLDATFRSIVGNGLARTTLATVAQEAGLSQGVAVFYFQTKDGMLTEALRDLYRTYEAHWTRALAAAGSDPAGQLRAIVAADFDPDICNPSILSVWFAFWGEQKFKPRYAEITQEFNENRCAAIREICMHLLPADHVRAANIAEWVDTLTDGYWQNIHLFPDRYDNDRALAAALDCIRALLPDFAEALR